MRRCENRIILGAILILIGVVVFIGNLPGFEQFHLRHVIFSFPTVLMVIGAIIIANSKNVLFGVITFFVGAAFMFLDIANLDNLHFPIIIIGIGLYILLKHKFNAPENNNKWHSHNNFVNDNNTASTRMDTDTINETAIFGGGNRYYNSQNFKGGDITCIFGGIELNLLDAKLAPGDVYLDVTAVFGGCEILVPRSWEVINQGTPIFGGFSIKNKNYIANVDKTSTLVIKGLALFGGVEVKRF